jgi:hypothetical protein
MSMRGPPQGATTNDPSRPDPPVAVFAVFLATM